MDSDAVYRQIRNLIQHWGTNDPLQLAVAHAEQGGNIHLPLDYHLAADLLTAGDPRKHLTQQDLLCHVAAQLKFLRRCTGAFLHRRQQRQLLLFHEHLQSFSIRPAA